MDEGFGDWSVVGCQVVSDTSNMGDVVKCECTHLSTFTVLLVGGWEGGRGEKGRGGGEGEGGEGEGGREIGEFPHVFAQAVGDPQPTVEPVVEFIVYPIVYIGLAISLIAILLTIITYLSSRYVCMFPT